MPQEVTDLRKKFFKLKKKILDYQKDPEVVCRFEYDLNIIVRRFVDNKDTDKEVFSAFSSFLLIIEETIDQLEKNNLLNCIIRSTGKEAKFVTKEKNELKKKMLKFKKRIVDLQTKPGSQCIFEYSIATIITRVVESEKTDENTIQALSSFVSIIEDTINHLEIKT